MKYIYTKDLCSACINLKRGYDADGVVYKERDANRLVEPLDEIDHEMFLKLAQTGKNPAQPELPVEIDVD